MLHTAMPPPCRRRPPQARYDDDVAEADAQAGRIVAALEPDRADTLVVVAADHGEAFGEHGEIGHSIFVYDTTLARAADNGGARCAEGTDRRRARVANRCRADGHAAARGAAIGRGRHRPRPRDQRRAGAGAGSLCRVLRAATRLRLESASCDLVGDVEVHRGAEARAVRPRPGSRGDARYRQDRCRTGGCAPGAGGSLLRPGRHRAA